MERIKFYSSEHNFERAIDTLGGFDIKKEEPDINGIIEFFVIVKIIEKTNCLEILQVNTDEKEKIVKVMKEYKKLIGCFFGQINNDNLIEIYEQVELYYKEEFFEVFECHKTYTLISKKLFKEICNCENFFIKHILQNKYTTEHFAEEVKKELLSNTEYARLLLDEYAIEGVIPRRPLHFPGIFTLKDREKLIKGYIDSISVNLNYLKMIVNTQKSNNLDISDKTRLLAKRKIESKNKEYFETEGKESGYKCGAEVQFVERQDDVFELTMDGGITKCSYDKSWIEENKDFSTLLNNFIYLFGYVDGQMRITLSSKNKELSIFEDSLSLKSKKIYKKGISFNMKNMLSDLQLIAYYEVLEKLDIKIEDIIEWFFKTYLPNQFNIYNYKINMPPENLRYFEKCKLILPEFEFLLKQYNLLVEDDVIEQEILQSSSTPLTIEKIKSRINKKYAYPNLELEEYKKINYYFFSDQCMLYYIERFAVRFEEIYENFYEIVINEQLKVEEYEGISGEYIQYLIQKNYIKENEEGFIEIVNPKKLLILQDLSHNEVIDYFKYPKTYRLEIDKLIRDDMLLIKSSLFSESEQKYFSYYLNKNHFNNSLELRNKYLHGSFSGIDSEEFHHRNYMSILKLFILTIIKINDDLCTYEDEKYR